ncbi:ABC transporter permease [Uliginosibacterium sp. sgz301328]|uniref:ABC transporter permease n=1 Tax=Uliginosibacterium sp. sgz301328 TaxID=3243764 RepID=UPI00359D5881
MHTLRLAWTSLLRDLRAGELTLLAVALLIAVTCLTSVGFLTDSLRLGLNRDANQLLGGDLLVTADHPLPMALSDEAHRLGVRVTETRLFNSMVSTDDVAQLAAVKTVDLGYPLRGSLQVAPAMGAPGGEAGRIPARGEAWLEERLVSGLGVKPGDSVQLGNSHFRVGALVTFESDRGTNFFSFIPRIIINAADLDGTGLIQEGSRVRYRLQFAGDKREIDALQTWLAPRLERGERIESIDNARPEVRNGLDRAHRFLRLAAMLAVVLAAVAIGLSSRRYLQRHLDGCAVMRCFGASRRQLIGVYLVEFVCFGLVVGALGCIVGFALQAGLAKVASSLVSAELPLPGPVPAVHGMLTSLVLVAGFIVPQLLRLTRVPPIRVLRREWDALEASSLGAWVVGALALAGLMLWVAQDIRLGLYVVGGFAAACVVFAVAGWIVLSLFARVRSVSGGWGLRYGLAALHRRLGGSVVQSVALALGLTAVLLLTLVTQDLLNSWRRNQSPDAPNQFVMNIQPEQRPQVRKLFTDNGLPAPDLLPMIRGRLVSINDRPVKGGDYEEDRTQRLAEREFNLSWASTLQDGNRVVAGRWHGDAHVPEFSMEEGIGTRLGIKLGDEVVFDIGGQRVTGKISSIRKLDWDSMRVNFFFTAAPGLLDDYPASYITSFRLPDGKSTFIAQLVGSFPNLSVIDVGQVISQVVSLTDKLISVVQFVLAFALVAGIVVLLSALQATHDERMYELSVLRSLGARRTQLRAAMLAEFAVLGLLAALLAIAAALGIGYSLSTFVFDLKYQPALAGLLGAGLLSALAVTIAGWLGVRGLLRKTVVEGLRAAA